MSFIPYDPLQLPTPTTEKEQLERVRALAWAAAESFRQCVRLLDEARLLLEQMPAETLAQDVPWEDEPGVTWDFIRQECERLVVLGDETTAEIVGFILASADDDWQPGDPMTPVTKNPAA